MQHGKNLKVLDSLYPSGLGVIDPNFQKKIESNHFLKKKKKTYNYDLQDSHI